MVRLSDLSEADREHLLAKDCRRLEGAPFVTGPPLARRRVAIVTTAGLHLHGDRSFGFRTAEYRVIPSDVATADIVMSHTSVNFDRTGFQADVNVVFPIDRLRELEQSGEIGSLARYHYAFMGAYNEPAAYEATAREVAGYLREDAVDAVLLVPV